MAANKADGAGSIPRKTKPPVRLPGLRHAGGGTLECFFAVESSHALAGEAGVEVSVNNGEAAFEDAVEPITLHGPMVPPLYVMPLASCWMKLL
jgi:hypothetical protein